MLAPRKRAEPKTLNPVLAVDIAMASGDVDENEEELLEAMQRVMNIDEDLAQKIVEVLALKYAR